MAQFFSYPYNYRQNFPKSKAARIVSNKRLDDFTEETSINFEFNNRSFDIDAIQVVGENIKEIKIGRSSSSQIVASLANLKFLVGRSGLLYTLDTSNNNKPKICSMDLTGKMISRITLIDLPSLLGFTTDGNYFYVIDNTKLYRINPGTGNNIQSADLVSEMQSTSRDNLEIVFHNNQLYMIKNNNIIFKNNTTKRIDIKSLSSFQSGLYGLLDNGSNSQLLQGLDKYRGDYNSADRYEIGDLVEESNEFYRATQNNPSGSPNPNSKYWRKQPLVDLYYFNKNGDKQNISPLTDLVSSGDHLYAINQNLSNNEYRVYKILYPNKNPSNPSIATVKEIKQNGKQYLFSDQFRPEQIKLPEQIENESKLITLTFSKIDSSEDLKIYQVLLLKKIFDIRYSSPTPGFAHPYIDQRDHVRDREIIQPSDFSQINPTEREQGVIVHQNTQGQRIKQRAYASQPKYQVSYDLPIRTLKQMRALQKFREETKNLNFTFAQNIVLYPDRIYPAHFSSFDLPINYISKTLAQGERGARYTCSFTVTQN